MSASSRAPVFLLSLHRTGSTLLHRMLDATGQFGTLRAHHIIHWSEILGGRMSSRESSLRAEDLFQRMSLTDRGFDAVRISPELPEEYGFVLEHAGLDARLRRASRHVLLHVIDFLRRENPDRSCVTLKNPWDFGSGPAIKALVPDAKLLYLHRNPGRVLDSLGRMVSSVVQAPNPYLATLSARYRAFLDDVPAYRGAQTILRQFPRVLRGLALRHMVQESKRYLASRAALPAADTLDVQYEALCAQPVRIFQQIMAWLGLSADCTGLERMVAPPPARVAGDVVTQKRALHVLRRYAIASGYDQF